MFVVASPCCKSYLPCIEMGYSKRVFGCVPRLSFTIYLVNHETLAHRNLGTH